MVAPSFTDPERYAIALVTAGSEAEAERLATALVEAGLVACANIAPVRSIYSWQGRVQVDSEWQLLLKTERARLSELEAKVRALHSYEVPETIVVPVIAGSEAYLSWLGASLTPAPPQ